MNKLILSGRLVRDVELSQAGQTQKATFTVATDGFKKDDSDFHRVTAFGKTAEFVSKYFTKGDGIVLEGRNSSGQYEKDGKTIYTYEVIADRIEFGIGTSKKDNATTNQPVAAAMGNAPAKPMNNIDLGVAPAKPADSQKSDTSIPWDLDL